MDKHRHEEFLKFLRTIDKEVPKGLAVHMVLDNYPTHTHKNVVARLAKHPRFQLHFTPTPSSWLNLGERWFRELTGKALRRGAFHSVPDLIAAIEKYMKVHNNEPRAFVWTAIAESILTKVRRGRVALNQTVSQSMTRHTTRVGCVRILGICFAGTSTPQRPAMSEFVSVVLGVPRHHDEGVEADLFKFPDGSSFAVASPGGMGDSARSLGFLVASLDEAVAELAAVGVATDDPAGSETERYVHFTAPDGQLYELVERL